jgi:uncharacterized protein YbjT (DUF2867 family)
MKVLVLGGTGTVGSQVVRELVARGADVRVLTRDPEKSKGLPRGAQPVRGDLLDPATIRSAFNGMDGLFLLNAVSATEAHEGLMAVNGARIGGVRKIAYLSVHRVDEAPQLPHFGGKLGIEAALKASGIACTSLRANNFYQNDYWYKDVILGYGIYPQPLGDVGCSRVDVRDIAEAAAISLTSDASGYQTFNVVGPRAHTGKSTAEVWSRALGKPVTYGGHDMDAWEKQAVQMLPAWMAFDFRIMYEHFQGKGLLATPEDIERLTQVLGHPPRSYEVFVDETAKSWKGDTAASDRARGGARPSEPRAQS